MYAVSARPARASTLVVRADAQAKFRRHAKDCGSPEVQISLLTARIEELSQHLQKHKKDYSSQRGLNMIISKRTGLLQYLESIDRSSYTRVCTELGLRVKAAGTV